MKYFIAENGQQAGPFEPNELLLHGLTVNSLVWCEGMAGWTTASQVPELMALLSGQTFNPGNVDMQLPPVPPVNQQPSQLPQVPPFGGQQSTQPTTYGQPTTTGKPYAPPQYGPSNNQPSNQLMPKTWLTESILATLVSLLCCGFNVIALVTGARAIIKANGVKSKFMRGDYAGANANSASAKKWMIITLVIGIVWACITGYRLMSDPGLLQQIQEGSGISSLYPLFGL